MTREFVQHPDGERTYLVKDGDVALGMQVSRGSTVGPMVLHVGFPFEPDGAGMEPEDRCCRPCEYVSTGRCYGTIAWYSHADDVWARAGGTRFHADIDPERLWPVLEDELRARGGEYRARAEAWFGWGI